METVVSSELVDALNELFTRSYYSAAGYVFESQPFVTDDDEPVLNLLYEKRAQERQHARMLAQIIDSLDQVPEAGAFPYWYRDLNYLTVPYMAEFVIESLETDVALFDRAIAMTPEHMGLARTMLESIKAEKLLTLDELRPLTAEIKAAEEKRYADGIAARKKARAERLAREKAAKEAAKAAPAAAGMPDPDEAGITNKEKARRVVAIIRARKAGTLPIAAAAPSGPSLADAAAAAGVLDPNEDGITNKEKGKRAVLWLRFKKKWEAEGGGAAGGAPSAGPSLEEAAKAAGVLDPNEDGISSKEKGKRRVLFTRFKKKWEKEQAEGGGAAAAAGPTLEQAAAAAGVLDPNEEGISSKEKGKRRVLFNRFKKKWEAEQAAGGGAPAGGAAPAQTLEQAAAAAGVLDPDEAGISSKEKGKRRVLFNRFKKKWEAEQSG